MSLCHLDQLKGACLEAVFSLMTALLLPSMSIFIHIFPLEHAVALYLYTMSMQGSFRSVGKCSTIAETYSYYAGEGSAYEELELHFKQIRVRAPQKSLKLAKDVEMKLHVCYISFVIYKLCSGEEGLVCVSQNATLASFSGVEMALSGFLPVKCCPPRGVVEIVHLVFSRLIIVVREM